MGYRSRDIIDLVHVAMAVWMEKETGAGVSVAVESGTHDRRGGGERKGCIFRDVLTLLVRDYSIVDVSCRVGVAKRKITQANSFRKHQGWTVGVRRSSLDWR